MKTLIIILSLITFSVSAETRLIIPFATTHIGSDNDKFNNQNYGLGIEYKGDYLYSATYLANNSYFERSLYLSVAKEFNFKHVSLSAGLALASGYEEISDSGILIVPVWGVQYENIRIVTTFPVSVIACPPDSLCADFVNVQAVIGF